MTSITSVAALQRPCRWDQRSTWLRPEIPGAACAPLGMAVVAMRGQWVDPGI